MSWVTVICIDSGCMIIWARVMPKERLEGLKDDDGGSNSTKSKISKMKGKRKEAATGIKMSVGTRG